MNNVSIDIDGRTLDRTGFRQVQIAEIWPRAWSLGSFRNVK